MTPVWCNRTGCPTRIVFARQAGTEKRMPYEAEDRTPPFSQETIGCHVLIVGEAFRPEDAVQHFMARFEIGEEQARELVSGYPWHRPHTHHPDDPVTTASVLDEAQKAVERSRFRYVGERELQAGLATVFDEAGISFEREVRFDEHNRIDFLLAPSGDRVGVEVKVDGLVEAVVRQLSRYAPHVNALLLVTTRSVHRFVPNELGDKPVRVTVIQGSAW